MEVGDATFPRGFWAYAWEGGPRLRMALLVSDRPATVAGRFTVNAAQAAPVQLCRRLVAGGVSQAAVINAGNANALTGAQGRADAERMQQLCGQALGIEPATVAVASTGVIGVPLPMAEIEAGIHYLAERYQMGAPSEGEKAARAILTTDTRPKTGALTVSLSGGTVRIGYMAKGSGMIHPGMATMLVFLTTDAAVAPAVLDRLVGEAVDASFHALSVDGDMSTNDTVLCWANGASGVVVEQAEDVQAFGAALTRLAQVAARQIAADGEGATHLITARVRGAQTVADARQKARAIIASALVKTAVYGRDPNWGRVLAAVGASGLPWDPARASLWMNGLCLYNQGVPLPFDEAEAKARMAAFEVVFEVALGEGEAEAEAWGCDLTEGYVDINAHYRT
ncbi:MAG: bifunctional glutamate N-acetyltransferase/amino-acid acetyltransferase ArgJ [Firmicutes bacterium]|nr:bifunctional glutamate N-acetyltransferase/amino-acid acetyltransferase ArgJ [Alicyclobacillaceae bacterium]MCL6498040.1 bifunctional glutamate N-acetyltransferase/amino-acid acetyltransferase ArgJ [Bacillota bacterium]